MKCKNYIIKDKMTRIKLLKYYVLKRQRYIVLTPLINVISF